MLLGNIFQQLYNIIYEEYKGAKMFTFGGIILNSESSVPEIGLDRFKFISFDELPYSIKIPNLTNREFQLIDKHLNEETEILAKEKILSSKEIDQYKEVYKYIPHFYDVRI